MKSKITAILTLCYLLASPVALSAATPDHTGSNGTSAVKIRTRRLPDLNTARSFHAAFVLNGELTVIGGHTSGFVPTATAEYLKDDEWHTVPMVYTHDGGMTLRLQSGEVLVGGGFEKNLGIGQTFSVERYNPATHTFEGFGCLDTQRAFTSAIETDSGHVIISGNWFHDDTMEEFDGKKNFTLVDSVLLQRCRPYLYRTARDNVMVLGGYDTRANTYDFPTTVDRLKGGPIDFELLRTWQPLYMEEEHRPELSFIGDEQRDIYAYLMAVENREGQIAVALVRNGTIELLPTTSTLPTVVGGKKLGHFTAVIADRERGRAYILGLDEDFRRYIYIIDYARAMDKNCRLNGKKAPLTIGYTDPLEGLGVIMMPVLTAEGDLFLAGGSRNHDNFLPGKGAWLLLVGSGEAGASGHVWWWLAALLAAVAACWIAYRVYRNYRRYSNYSNHNNYAPDSSPTPDKPVPDEALMARIEQLMTEKQPYKRPDLKLADVAAELNTNSSYITNCIRQCRGCTFPQFIAAYRVDYAQQMLRNNPDMDFTSAYLASGFANETTFFRTFKRITGVTPKEWTSGLKE